MKRPALNEFAPGKMMTRLRKIFRRNGGQSLVEYVLIISLIAIVLIASLNLLGATIVAIPFANVIAVL